ncbi:MAG: hypothetical protein AB7P20_25820 [Rhizobiaceae bacterium]
MKLISTAALLALATVAPALAQEAAALTGTYCGKLWSAGEIVSAVTELRVEPDGRLAGRYEFDDGPDKTSGTLIEEKQTVGRKRTLIWKDVYGTGKLVITFNAGLDGFTGLWGADWEEPDAQWDGSRCNRAISMLQTDQGILR